MGFQGTLGQGGGRREYVFGGRIGLGAASWVKKKKPRRTWVNKTKSIAKNVEKGKFKKKLTTSDFRWEDIAN